MHSQARDSFQIIHTQRGRSNDSPIKDEDSKVLRDSHWVGPTEWEEESDLESSLCDSEAWGQRDKKAVMCVLSTHTLPHLLPYLHGGTTDVRRAAHCLKGDQ
jgi:hypothetical protein